MLNSDDSKPAWAQANQSFASHAAHTCKTKKRGQRNTSPRQQAPSASTPFEELQAACHMRDTTEGNDSYGIFPETDRTPVPELLSLFRELVQDRHEDV